MIANIQRKWLYIEPPKTGTWATHGELQKPHFGGVDVELHGYHHGTIIPEDMLDYMTFATVRCPYSRAVSLWHMRKTLAPWNYGTKTFRLFCDEVLAPDKWMVDPFYGFTVSEWLRHIRVDYHIRQESLQHDLEQLGLHSEPFVMTRENVTESDVPWWVYYKFNHDLIDAVLEWGKEDFYIYEYDRDITSYYSTSSAIL